MPYRSRSLYPPPKRQREYAAAKKEKATPIELTGHPELLTDRQQQATRLLASDARHVCLVGGSRSGKTGAIMRAVISRALRSHSRHAVLRFRAVAVWPSIALQTIPWVLATFWPEMKQNEYRLYNHDRYLVFFKTGSEIWLGGLDEKGRTEKILGNEYCVSPDAKILTADLRWVAASTLSVGDDVIGFPESLDGWCTLEPSRVERSDIIQARRVRVTTTRGTTVVSVGHRFVSYHDDRRHKNFRSFSWKTAADLVPGDNIRFATGPWDAGTSYDDGWLAGVYDGEGWISIGGQCGFGQRTGAVLDRVRRLLADRGIKFRVHGAARDMVQIVAVSIWDALHLIGSLRPLRLFPDAHYLWKGRRGFVANGSAAGRATGQTVDPSGRHVAVVLSIEDLGVGPVVALGTSTKTFIADGFLGHNSTIYFNECSELPYSSVLIAQSRLAQVTKVLGTDITLRQRAYYDLNPTGLGHWTNTVFGEHKDPVSKRPLESPENYKRMFLNPFDNREHLDPEYLKSLDALPARVRSRFRDGQYVDETESTLWPITLLEETRITKEELPELARVIVAVDPSGAASELDTSHDAIGIMVVGVSRDRHAYVLADYTMLAGPNEWGRTAVAAFHRHKADRIVAETNFGGAMVEFVIRTVDPSVPYKMVTASRGKTVRAEPVAALYAQHRVHHVGRFDDLEDELMNFTDLGYVGERSPNRADSAIWAISELCLEENASAWVEHYKQVHTSRVALVTQNVLLPSPPLSLPMPEVTTVSMTAPAAHMGYFVSAPNGNSRTYTSDAHRQITADPVHADALERAGCRVNEEQRNGNAVT